MLLKVLFVICIAAEMFFVPIHFKYAWPYGCKTSLIYKMLSSTMFVSIGVLSMLIAGNFSSYAVFMVIGLVCGWFGDYFLHGKMTNTFFVIGFLFFLANHIMYINAFMRASNALIPGFNKYNTPEVIAVIAMVVFAVAVGILSKMEFSPKFFAIGVLVYAFIISIMAVRAVSLGYNIYIGGAEHGLFTFVSLTLGAIGFVLSDSTLAIIMFCHKRTKPLKLFNLLTYFWGQILLAQTILTVVA
ncbi:MAG: hypothetical protein KIG53_00345 [Oscillospiraceae bacterium]|nr:hypothetical protein [Oscillospiraceae bacterium]